MHHGIGCNVIAVLVTCFAHLRGLKHPEITSLFLPLWTMFGDWCVMAGTGHVANLERSQHPQSIVKEVVEAVSKRIEALSRLGSCSSINALSSEFYKAVVSGHSTLQLASFVQENEFLVSCILCADTLSGHSIICKELAASFLAELHTCHAINLSDTCLQCWNFALAITQVRLRDQ